MIWLVALLVAVGSMIGCGKIFEAKGREKSNGYILGFFLGVIGLIIAVCLSDKNEEAAEAAPLRSTHRECPSCKEAMRRDASVCPRCRSSSRAWRWDGKHWWHESESGLYWLDEDANRWVSPHEITPPAATYAVASPAQPPMAMVSVSEMNGTK